MSIQYRQLSDDLVPVGSFQIMVEWEWGEKQIIQMILNKGVLEPTWDFVPVGNRLRFDLTFLIERATKWKLLDWDAAKLKYFWFTKPLLDLQPVLVLMNAGQFTGSSLGAFARKDSGGKVPTLFRQGRVKEIIEYITQEHDAMLGVLRAAADDLKALGDRRRRA
ncbi:MAG TPA: hypothetical protein VJ326_03380 [Thermoplasmata archaeon]|nr:hypothetical protein [Thermoplasmata archaeon]